MESRDYESVVLFRERFRAMLAALTAAIPSALQPLAELDEDQRNAAELLALCVQLASILHCPALRVDEKSIRAYQKALSDVIEGVGEHAASLTVRCLQQVGEYGSALDECRQRGIDEAESPRARLAAIDMAECYGAIVLEFLRKVEDRFQRLNPPQPHPWPVGYHL